MAPNYQNGKIYKIESVLGKCCYIGSTTQLLNSRFSAHKNYKKTTSRHVFEFEDACIILIENFPCENKKELTGRERFYIEKDTCVNRNVPGRTKQEYDATAGRKLNKKKYESKPEYKAHRNEKFTCLCGGKYTHAHKARHLKTTIHKKYVEDQIVI